MKRGIGGKVARCDGKKDREIDRDRRKRKTMYRNRARRENKTRRIKRGIGGGMGEL